MRRIVTIPFSVVVGTVAAVPAQSLFDLTEKRNPVLPYRSLFEIEAGATGAFAST